MDIAVKRIYEDPRPEDGQRILVDRLWPRGMKKESAKLNLWLKEIAPSNQLRKAFHQGDFDWPVFRDKYISELAANRVIADTLKELAEKGKITLLYSVKNTEQNHAVILKHYLEEILHRSK